MVENRTGIWEVFLASFPSFHYIKQVSVAGGAQPRWRGDGRELFFIDLEGKMTSVTVPRGSPPNIGVPRKLFDTGLVPDPTINQYAVTEDGLKFWCWNHARVFSKLIRWFLTGPRP